jgi:NAD-reducing hydrogenase large subunit
MTQKITIEPVTRIEGHAKVTIHMKDDGTVDHAYMHVNEFRGFEKFCEGRLYFEMPQITPRICGICPVSHHLAAAKAADALTGQTPPRPASLLRELMHMGQIVQSHGMHFFELAGPDLLLGFDAPPEIRSVVGLIGGRDDAARRAAYEPAVGRDDRLRHTFFVRRLANRVDQSESYQARLKSPRRRSDSRA